MLHDKMPRTIIENVQPTIDAGRYPIKREVGDSVRVTADIFKDGHDILTALLKFRVKGEQRWHEVPMTHIGNDTWEGTFFVDKNALYEYTIEAYGEIFLSWRDELEKKIGKYSDLTSELLEGNKVIRKSKDFAPPHDQEYLENLAHQIESNIEHNQPHAIDIALGDELKSLMLKYPNRTHATECEKPFELIVDRVIARYASWYEFFPRSQGTDPTRSATFKECEDRLPEIAEMGFDVLYMPPIHPIGRTNRKGANNSLHAGPDDPGCPYAIGNETGGHKAIDPALGTFEDFERFRLKAQSYGIELSLDIAINCSPDHPYVKEHPEWFYKRPDGTIKFSENPPKKYEDIYSLDFYCDDWKGLWEELLSVFLFWAEKGVVIFRVDNPHTKPVAFWEWCITEVKKQYPESIFLAEAFTKPKMMKVLAKCGFTQSYTYFTWRNFKQEIMDYLNELTTTSMAEYFRANFFANTPDILPTILQEGGTPAFKHRAVLAATLSSVYGIYSGYELCENRAVPGKEEYIDSEKYQFKVWDWNRPGNIKPYITRINRIRRRNKALQEYDNLRFYHAENDNILFYGKATPDLSNIILITVNLDPFNDHHTFVYVPTAELGLGDHESYEVHDLLTNEKYIWRGSRNYVHLTRENPAHIFRVITWRHSEEDFDYYY